MSEKDFDDFVNKLQKRIIDEELKEYNPYIVDLFHDPKNWGNPEENNITISESYKGPCGDTMKFFLRINNNIIKKANFITDGCGASVATGSQTTLMIEGKSLDYAESLNPKDIDKALNGLPEDHKHCAELAARTLKRAISNYKKNKTNF